jgi:hypothetical protein
VKGRFGILNVDFAPERKKSRTRLDHPSWVIQARGFRKLSGDGCDDFQKMVAAISTS